MFWTRGPLPPVEKLNLQLTSIIGSNERTSRSHLRSLVGTRDECGTPIGTISSRWMQMAGALGRCARNQPGLTVVETLVAMMICGTLFALLLIGIQSAREAGRRSQCESHLRQMGIAVAAYESNYKVIPPGHSDGSLHFTILPFIEQNAVYARLTEHISNGNYSYAPPSDLQTISVYLCPSDGGVVQGEGRPGTNYAGNCGIWWPTHGWNGFFVYWRKVSNNDEVGPIRISDVTDGLSNTIAITELLRGCSPTERLRVIWKLPKGASDIDNLANQCRSIPPDPPEYGWIGGAFMRGTPWTDGNLGFTLNNHVLPPNQPSCSHSMYHGAYSAASHHPGGVNVLLGDGRIQFFSDDVNIRVWRALASRAGGEANLKVIGQSVPQQLMHGAVITGA